MEDIFNEKNKIRENENNIENNNKNESNKLDENLIKIFREKVKKWLEMDNDIKTLECALKERKKNRNILQIDILEFMGKYNIKDMNAGNSKLLYHQSKTKKAFTEKSLKEQLTKYFNNADDAINIAEYLFNNREYTFKTNLKRKNLKLK